MASLTAIFVILNALFAVIQFGAGHYILAFLNAAIAVLLLKSLNE